jgi:hypothetical protein
LGKKEKKMKKSVKLIALLAALVLILVAYLLAAKLSGGDEQETDSAEETVTYTVAEINPNALSAISFTYKESSYTYTLKDDGTGWLWSENTDLVLSTEPFVSMVQGFTALTSATRLTSVSDEEYARYGLSTPTLSVTFTQSGKDLTYVFGIMNTYNGLYYVANDANRSTVYMVDGSMLEAFGVKPDEMILHDTLVNPALKKIVSLVLEADGKTFTYTYTPTDADELLEGADPGVWMVSIDGGEPFYPSDEVSGGLCLAIPDMKFDEFITYDKTLLSEYGLESGTRLTVNYKETVTNPTENGGQASVDLDKSFTIIIGAPADNGLFYAKLESSPYVYTLSPAILGNLCDVEMSADGAE